MSSKQFRNTISAFIIATCLPAVLAVAASAKETGPTVGAGAPEIGPCSWFQKDKDNPAAIAELRGKVVLVHTFAVGCVPCERKGVPLVAEAVRANADRGLTAISITAYNPELEKLLAKNGVTHSVAMMSVNTKTCPYVDISRNGFTYVFVVGRDGLIAWRGNHTVKDRDFLKAVAGALAVKPVPALEGPLASELDKAAAFYMQSRFKDSRKAARAVMDRHAHRTDSRSEKVVRDAAALIERIDTLSAELASRMQAAWENRSAVAFVEAGNAIENGFAGTETNKRAMQLVKEAAADREFAAGVKAALEWIKLIEERPVLFPVSRERGSRAFEKKLAKFIRRHEGKESVKEAITEAEKLLSLYRKT